MNVSGSGWQGTVAKQLVGTINRALAVSPGAQKHLKNLEHCVLKLKLTGVNLTFYFGVAAKPADAEATPSYVVQTLEAVDAPDVSLSGSPLSFIKLVGQGTKTSLFRSKALDLQGDAVRIQQILALLNSLSVDWEALLANLIGGVPAHLVGSTVRSGVAWGLSFSQAFLRDAEEYIKFELRLLPDKARASKQFSGITQLAQDVEALQARFDRLDKDLRS